MNTVLYDLLTFFFGLAVEGEAERSERKALKREGGGEEEVWERVEWTGQARGGRGGGFR